MHTRNLLVALGAILVIGGAACGLSACSGGGGSAQTPNPTPTPTPASTPTPNDNGLPPDPGDAGKATLAGVDSDKDGVRDDVQRYIALTYPDSEKTRAALTQYAKSVQDTVVFGGSSALTKEKALTIAEAASKAIDCIFYVDTNADDASTIASRLEAAVQNTKARLNAYVQFMAVLGSVTLSTTPTGQEQTACEFNVASMTN